MEEVLKYVTKEVRVPREVIREVEVIQKVPRIIETIREVPKITERIIEIPIVIKKEVERIVEVPFERVVENIVEVPVERIVEVPKIIKKEVEKEVFVKNEVETEDFSSGPIPRTEMVDMDMQTDNNEQKNLVKSGAVVRQKRGNSPTKKNIKILNDLFTNLVVNDNVDMNSWFNDKLKSLEDNSQFNSPTRKIDSTVKALEKTGSQKDIFNFRDTEQMPQFNDTTKKIFEEPKFTIPPQNVNKVNAVNPKIDSDHRGESTEKKVKMNEEIHVSRGKLENRPEELEHFNTSPRKELEKSVEIDNNDPKKTDIPIKKPQNRKVIRDSPNANLAKKQH